eukprot:5264424-Prymnesium_polylepis.1
MSRFELQLAQCIRTFERYPDMPTMTISVKPIGPDEVDPVSVEGKTLVPDELDWNKTLTLTVARVDDEWAV